MDSGLKAGTLQLGLCLMTFKSEHRGHQPSLWKYSIYPLQVEGRCSLERHYSLRHYQTLPYLTLPHLTIYNIKPQFGPITVTPHVPELGSALHQNGPPAVPFPPYRSTQ